MYQSQISQQAFEYLNNLRQNPKLAVPKLQEHLKYFKGTVLNLPGEIGLMTNEGPKAYNECIEFLKKQKPLAPLTYAKGLEQASLDHVNDTGPKGITGHNGSDGCQLGQRIERYGQWQSTIGENISYGQKTGEDVIIQLIVDDGVPSRGHRVNCFNPDFKVVGIASGAHKQYKTMCVFDLAGGFVPKGGAAQGGAPQVKGQNNGVQQKNPKMDMQNDHGFDNMGGFGKMGGFPNMQNMGFSDMGQMQMQTQGQKQGNGGGGKGGMPPGCVNMSTSTSVSVINGKKHTKITKKYIMGDGSTLTEIEEIDS